MKVIEARDALAALHGGRPYSFWCNYGPTSNPPEPGQGGDRVYKPFLDLQWTPKFKVAASSRFFAAGSCFARNIEKALHDNGADVASWSPGAAISHEALHRYNTFSILHDFNLALTGGLDESALVETESGQWFDFSAYGKADTREELAAARRQCIDLHRGILETDVLVITLGLVEAWFDRKTGTYLNVFPTSAARQDPDRYELRITDYAENLAALDEFWAALRDACRPGIRMVVTVSPVPFNATFSGQDVVVANTYSKAVLRAVAEDFAAAHDDVMYFPSYEMVTLSDPRSTWTADMRHVQAGFVEQIMAYFIRNCVDAPEHG